jgi:dihydroflavonol-4-reductase
MPQYPNILVIGGTGFLGYHAVRLFLRCSYHVTILALPPLPAEGLFPAGVTITLADVNALSDAEVINLFTGQDALVFAAGADDRTTPKRPAYTFFQHANVVVPARLFRLAQQAGVRRGVVLCSYFTFFARTWPDLHLDTHHPYIRSRLEQEEACLRASHPALELMILQLPYIFGSMPGRIPLWAPLIGYLSSSYPLFYPRGGTNCVAVEQVAEAILGAVERGKGGERYLVGDENLSWEELLTRLGRLLNKPKRVHTLPDALVRLAAGGVRLWHQMQGRESGLDPVHFIRMQTAHTFFDPAPAQQALGFSGGGLDQALADTVAACLMAAAG